MCACKHKGPRTGGGTINVSDMTAPERPSSTFIPPPPRKRDDNRAPMSRPTTTVVQSAPQGSPRTDVARPFVPPAPPPSKDIARLPAPPLPKRVEDAPIADEPRAFVPPPPPPKSDNGVPLKQGGLSPAPLLTQVGLAGPSQSPGPFADYCADPRVAMTELCRSGADSGLSSMCRSAILNFLASKDTRTIREWAMEQELCRDEILRALGTATGMAKASARLYGASGAMPNYYRASGDAASDARDAEWNRQRLAALSGGGVDPAAGGYQGASSWTYGGAANLGFGGVGGDLYAPPAPTTPPPNYGAIIGGIGQAVGGVFQGINTAVANANAVRLQELQMQFANQANGAQLALQRQQLELQAEIARLNASGGGGAAGQQLQMALQQQQAANAAALAAAGTPMSDTTKAVIAVGVVGAVGVAAYLLTRKRGR
jgi:hypothetical protein